MSDILSESSPKARKNHRCIWCWTRIDKGEQYTRQVLVDSGELQSNPYHPECFERMLAVVEEEGGFFEWIPGIEERPKR